MAATVFSNSQINLNWSDAAPAANGIIVEYSTDGTNFSQVASLSGTATSDSVTGLASGTNYFFRVWAYNTGVSSANSNVASATTSIAAPTGLSASAASNSEVNLTWTDNVEDEDGYYVQDSINGTTWTTVDTVGPQAGTGQSLSDAVTGLMANTPYSFRVQAFKGSLMSSYSNTSNATTLNQLTSYSQNFEGTIGSEWSSTSTFVDAANSSNHILGRLGSGGATLTLQNLPPGDNMMSLTFTVYALNNWQGNSGGPSFTVTSDGTSLLNTNFSNDTSSNPGNPQQAFGGVGQPNGSYPARTAALMLYTDHDNDRSGPYSSSSLPDSAYQITLNFAHTGATDAITFAAPGASGINGFGLDNVSVQVTRPTVSIAATTATTSDGSSTPGVFSLTRTGDLSQSQTVQLVASGTALSGSGGDYSALPTSATFAAGESTTTVSFTPASDNLVKPTLSVIESIAAGSAYAIGTKSAAATIADGNAVSLTLDGVPQSGQPSPGAVVEVDHDADSSMFYPVQLTVPARPGSGTVTLTEIGASGNDVWLSQAGGTPIQMVIGSIDGHTVSQATWVAGSQPSMLFVDPTVASAVPQDKVFTVAFTPFAGAVTTQLAASGDVTNWDLIVQYAGTGAQVQNNANHPQTVVVGQNIVLSAALLPAAWNNSSNTYSWSIDGFAVENYTQTGSSASVQSLTSGDLSQGSVSYYWTRDSDGVPLEVSTTITKNPGTIQALTFTNRSTYFNVVSPQAKLSLKATVHNPSVWIGPYVVAGNPAFAPNVQGTAMHFGNSFQPGVGDPGVTINATVDTSNHISEGTIEIVQLSNTSYNYDKAPGATTFKSSGGMYLLDNGGSGEPYAVGAAAAIDRDKQKSISIADSPGNPLVPQITHVSRNDSFTDFLMYRPAGGIWVTLATATWQWYGTADWVGGAWNLTSGGSYVNPQGARSSTLPKWDGTIIGTFPTAYP